MFFGTFWEHHTCFYNYHTLIISGLNYILCYSKEIADNFIDSEKKGSKYRIVNSVVKARSSSCWFTNIEHGHRHVPLKLMSMDDNKKYSKHKEVRGCEYDHYDNYNAIEVPFYDAIPGDYEGLMGVPITFLDKYCPEQFEIVGITQAWFGMATKIYPKQVQVSKSGKKSVVTKLNDGPAIKLDNPIDGGIYYIVDGNYYAKAYARILIRKKRI